MGRRPSPWGYSVSRYNRLAHGVMIEGVLPSRGLDACPLSEDCPCHEDDLRELCVPGQPCPCEVYLRDRYIEDAYQEFAFARLWLSDDEFKETIDQLGVLTLQRRRLSALLARVGHLRPKVHRVSKLSYGIELTPAAGRYATALDRTFSALMHRLLDAPDADDGDPGPKSGADS